MKGAMPSQSITRSLLIKGALLAIGVETVLMEKLILGRRSNKTSPPCGGEAGAEIT
ncbi:hypothetical protein GCM10008012_05040 [Rhizobium anhuiense]|nr:hypothetical protein GCM10008012_05040 [Rhizobium anhuiense]